MAHLTTPHPPLTPVVTRFYRWRELLTAPDGSTTLGTTFDPMVDEYDPCDATFDTADAAIDWLRSMVDDDQIPDGFVLTRVKQTTVIVGGVQ